MNWIKGFLCSWTHGGGHIKRDSQRRINWQCKKCGRWSDPVPFEQEKRMIDCAIEAKYKEKEKNK